MRTPQIYLLFITPFQPPGFSRRLLSALQPPRLPTPQHTPRGGTQRELSLGRMCKLPQSASQTGGAWVQLLVPAPCAASSMAPPVPGIHTQLPQLQQRWPGPPTPQPWCHLLLCEPSVLLGKGALCLGGSRVRRGALTSPKEKPGFLISALTQRCPLASGDVQRPGAHHP